MGTLGEDEVLSGGEGGREELESSELEDAGEDDSADEPEDSSLALLSELEGWPSEGTEPSSCGCGSLSWDVSELSSSSVSFLFSQRGLKVGRVGTANARADDEKFLCVSRVHFLGYSGRSRSIFGDAARVVNWLNALRNS